MDLNWLETIAYGFVSGLAEILPISADAHSILILKLFGTQRAAGLQPLLIHLAILAALFYSSQAMLIKMARARKLARIPKRRRKRPLDVKSLMDSRFLITMLIPMLPAYFLFAQLLARVEINLILLAAFLFLNGLLLYIPQFFPSSNKDSRSLSRIDGLLMGIGGAVSVLPGFSGIGASVSIGSIRGVDRVYALNMALIMNMIAIVILGVYDILAIISGGLGVISISILLRYLLSAAAAFIGSIFAIRVMRSMASESGYTVFGYYCWGVALFAFILNLMA